MPDKHFIGVDVAQDWVDIADTATPNGPVRRIANTPEALRAWAASLDAACVGLVAFEPTGGLERPLRRALAAAGLAFARVPPNEVVAFAPVAGSRPRPTPSTPACSPTSPNRN